MKKVSSKDGYVVVRTHTIVLHRYESARAIYYKGEYYGRVSAYVEDGSERTLYSKLVLVHSKDDVLVFEE